MEDRLAHKSISFSQFLNSRGEGGGTIERVEHFKLKSQWVVITMSSVLKLMSKIFVCFFLVGVGKLWVGVYKVNMLLHDDGMLF